MKSLGPMLFTLFVASAASAAELRQPVIGDVIVTAYRDDGGRQDYTCADHTYRGHQGTDIAIIGRFAAMDDGRDVVAAAAGRVVRTHDGEFDRCETADCAGGGGFGNHVAIEHDDGMVTWYAHLRRDSVRVAVGDPVACGDVIGQVGSSGFSTGPHLHFEVRPGGLAAAADDPFSGPCGGPLSFWIDQGPYRGLPGDVCAAVGPPDPPPGPDLYLDAALALPDRPCDFDDCRDAIRDGTSRGVADAWVGQTLTWTVIVLNQGAGPTAAERPEDAAVEFEYALPPSLALVRYAIESDHPGHDQRAWRRSDAMDNAHNPPPDGPQPTAGVLRLNAFSSGEAKRVIFTIEARARSIGMGPAALHGWIRHVRDVYGEKTSWDDPVEVNVGQTYGDGDLRIGEAIDVFDATRFVFDAPDAELVEGWRTCGDDVVGLEVHPESASLAVEIVGDRPCIESPWLGVDVADLRGARLAFSHGQGAQTGVLAWATVDDPSFDRSRQALFDSAGDGRPETVELAPAWQGTLARVRLWPMLRPGEGDPIFRLDEVALTRDAPDDPMDMGAPEPTDMTPRPPRDMTAPAEDVGPTRRDMAPFDAGRADTGPPRADASDADAAASARGCATLPANPASGWVWAMLIAIGARRRRGHSTSSTRPPLVSKR